MGSLLSRSLLNGLRLEAPTSLDPVQESPERPATLPNLDLLRGIAAIAVLLWHYQHFFYASADVPPPPAFRADQPFFQWLAPLYLNGWMAVQLFWTISGFVLFHVYGRRPHLNGHQYFWARFARLYPLHLITLLMVAAVQAMSLSTLGHYQIYGLNDPYHFFLQLFMASNWGFEKGFSFNAPIWSVSAEIISYFVFFLYCRSSPYRLLPALCLTAACFLGMRMTDNPVVACVCQFFLGCLAGSVFHRLANRPTHLKTMALALLLLGAGITYLARSHWPMAMQFLLFPLLVLSLALLDRGRISAGRFGIRTGQLTYASYLIHVPLQITILTVLDQQGVSRDIANRPLFFVAFIVGTLLISAAVFRYIELPLKQWVTGRAHRAAA